MNQVGAFLGKYSANAMFWSLSKLCFTGFVCFSSTLQTLPRYMFECFFSSCSHHWIFYQGYGQIFMAREKLLGENYRKAVPSSRKGRKWLSQGPKIRYVTRVFHACAWSFRDKPVIHVGSCWFVHESGHVICSSWDSFLQLSSAHFCQTSFGTRHVIRVFSAVIQKETLPAVKAGF